MAKSGTKTFACTECGAETPKWAGRCPNCSAWNTLVEHKVPAVSPRGVSLGDGSAPLELSQVDIADAPRFALPFREVNRVLGGGIVPGSLTLIGGDPGIGKSTLMLQLAQAVASERRAVLYVSGEESPQQIKLRADRLGIAGQRLLLLAETDLDQVLQRLAEVKPALAIVDSIQTMYLPSLDAAAGSVAQVRECALRLMQWAKSSGIPVLIAGHVTKDGVIAGPRLLEHMVDVVLYLEGEASGPLRILRGVKNRFGSTNEVGIFEMRDAGLVEVDNPSRAFLAHRQETARGSVIVPVLEGTRPLLVEVQALVTPTSLPAPRRTSNGFDTNRVLLIAAVLTKHLGVPLGAQDIIVNVAGGLRITEPAADLGVALAILSSYRDAPLKAATVAFGEVGLSGELRPVSQTSRRLGEAAALGFTSCVLPQSQTPPEAPNGLTLLAATTLREAIRLGLASSVDRRPRPVMGSDEDL